MAQTTILVTRAANQAKALADPLTSAGARVICLPMIEFAPPETWGPVDAAIDRFETYDGVIFTSANAVDTFMDRLATLRREPNFRKIYAIGTQTQQVLSEHGYSCQLADEPRAEGLLSVLGDVDGIRLLLPRAAEAREILPDTLRERGAVVDVVPVYRTQTCLASAAPLLKWQKHGLDWIIFMSPSAVRGFLELGGDLEVGRIAAMGPVTAAELPGEADLVSTTATAEGLAEALIQRLKST